MKTIHILLSVCIIIVFIMSTNNSMAQVGTTCATAWNIPLDSCTGASEVIDGIVESNTPASSCTSTLESEGWYSFTIPPGPNQSITVFATGLHGSNGLAIQAISGTCSSETEIGCVNNIPGQGFQSETLNLLNLAPGIYYLRIINDEGTQGAYVDLCLSATSVGISEPVNDHLLTISPNPFTFETTISFEKEMVNGILSVSDVTGKKIKTINFSGKELILEKGEMNAGIYFLQAADEKKNVLNRKIIIQ